MRNERSRRAQRLGARCTHSGLLCVVPELAHYSSAAHAARSPQGAMLGVWAEARNAGPAHFRGAGVQAGPGPRTIARSLTIHPAKVCMIPLPPSGSRSYASEVANKGTVKQRRTRQTKKPLESLPVGPPGHSCSHCRSPINDLPAPSMSRGSMDSPERQHDARQFDRFVTLGGGRPPSQNPGLLNRVVPRFVLQSRLQFPDALLLTQVGSFYEVRCVRRRTRADR